MSDNKHTKDIVDAVKQDDMYTKAVAELPKTDRDAVEATVESFATLLGPLIAALDGLEQSDEVMAAVRVRLAEKMRSRS